MLMCKHGIGKSGMIERNITVVNKLGLHARASSKLAQLSNKFSSQIELGKDGQFVDCKSIMALMLLAAGIGTALTLRVEGEDENTAAEEVEALFVDFFGEGE